MEEVITETSEAGTGELLEKRLRKSQRTRDQRP